MRWSRLVALMGASILVYRALFGKPDGKRPLGRPKNRWKGNVKTDLQKVVLGGMDSSDLDQNRDRWWSVVKALRKRFVL